MELQELYNSQQLLTAELTDKLEKTEVRYQLTEYLFILCALILGKIQMYNLVMQKKLEETEHSLVDLEEKHRQANATIKEKEFLISNLLKSGKHIFLPSTYSDQILIISLSTSLALHLLSQNSMYSRHLIQSGSKGYCADFNSTPVLTLVYMCFKSHEIIAVLLNNNC